MTLKKGPKEWFGVKMTNVIMPNRVIDKSVDLKQKSEFCYGGGAGNSPWAPRLFLMFSGSIEKQHRAAGCKGLTKS